VFDRRGGDSCEDAGEIGLGIDTLGFGGADERVERGGGAVVAGEQPVLPADGDPLQGTLGGVVVDGHDL